MRSLASAAPDKFGTGLWLRVDDANAKILAFDNMGKRRLTGTQAPSDQFVVLDVADDATHIAFGVLLSGGGEVWTSQVVIEVVGVDVPTTG